MPQISTVKNAVQSVVKKDRLLNAVFAGTKSMAFSFGRTFYALWLQMTGLIFLFFAVNVGFRLIKQYRKDHFADHKILWMGCVLLLVSVYFTALSFIKAKRTLKRK